ncbi:MAG TPA: metallophosphoesterase [Actinopolymorphaceae bacterium]
MHRSSTRMRLLATATAVVLAGTALPVAASGPGHAADKAEDLTFTLAVIPDTQIAVERKPELFYAQTQWVLDHHSELRIPFVVHVGDVVEWPSRLSDWDRSRVALDRLDGVVPYGISIGNHDLDAWACEPPTTCSPWEAIREDRSVDTFNEYFPRSKFAAWQSFGGSYPEGRSDSSYFTFRAGGVDWLVLNIRFWPTDEELAWAARVVAEHPDRQVIVNTHEYQSGTTRTAEGERIWNAVVRKYPNVQFVLSGHFTTAGMRVDEGDHGNKVYQIQADYQTYDRNRVDENSYLRLMHFRTRGGSVTVRTFSPYCEQTGSCPAYKTDPDNEFTIDRIDFPNRRKP